MVIQGINDLKVYKKAYELANQIFYTSKNFPKEETYALTDQIRRSSRSVSANIRDGFAKRRYKQVFVKYLTDSLGSSEETRCWLAFARDCKYIDIKKQEQLDLEYDEINAMLYSLIKKWERE